MDKVVHPGPAPGRVVLPPSKSQAHRALFCAAMARGESWIGPRDHCRDLRVTVAALGQLGAAIEGVGDRWHVRGVGGPLPTGQLLDCGASATTWRLLVPWLALEAGPWTLTGEAALLARPMGPYRDLFRARGLPFQLEGDRLLLQGPLEAGLYRLPGHVSSQFISGLLLALPLLPGDSRIILETPLASAPYVALTQDVQAAFGVSTSWVGEREIHVPGGQVYSPCAMVLEPDASHWAALAALAGLRGPTDLPLLPRESLQADRAMIPLLEAWGARLEARDGRVRVGPGVRRPLDLDITHCPDMGPIAIILAAFTPGTSRILGVDRLRDKESDRLAAMEETLTRMGTPWAYGEGALEIRGRAEYPGGCDFDGYGDHRIIMAQAVAARAMERPSVIRGAQHVDKSFPDFWQTLA